MKKWKCMTCGYIYDEAKGMPEFGIEPGTPLEELPDNWECLDCGSTKNEFIVVGT